VQPTELKSEVRAFWNRQSCDTQHAKAEKFSREYFDQIEERRYSGTALIHSFAQFTRYHGRRILEVGFGAGTDFRQWLRAGAVASGVDLTEEALRNLERSIEVYRLPAPECALVADAENLPFPSDSFDLGYSWGVLHHTPDTEKALAELVRVVRPGGEIKVMLYNRHSIYAFGLWLRLALGRGRPWKSLRWVLWNHVESIGTKGYTRNELRRMLGVLPLSEIRIDTFLTSVDQLRFQRFPFLLANGPLALLVALGGNRFGWAHCIYGRKLAERV
jgi:ubiquinone/menaquinone biosynthesis C-methylase UbiE